MTSSYCPSPTLMVTSTPTPQTGYVKWPIKKAAQILIFSYLHSLSLSLTSVVALLQTTKQKVENTKKTNFLKLAYNFVSVAALEEELANENTKIGKYKNTKKI